MADPRSSGTHTRSIVPLAPRYDPRLLAALRRVDDRRQPIAETCRRVGEVAEALGVPRPSYVHLRRLVLAERERQDAVREVLANAAHRASTGQLVDAYAVAGRLRDAAS